jgi:hypothetical protein
MLCLAYSNLEGMFLGSESKLYLDSINDFDSERKEA